jgi:MFS transporter, SHS family, sialic acid transporter
MTQNAGPDGGSGRWLALTAALLGWMFDGFEMGLFPLVAGPAIHDLMPDADRGTLDLWFGVATSLFLIGAATGGVLFGWLGDRLGRVRAMTFSVLTYAIFSGLCGFAAAPWQIAGLRFIAALGMGGEWSLGVALVMELWPDSSRAWLAGIIGSSANFGYLLVGVLSMGLASISPALQHGLLNIGMSPPRVEWLTGNSAWRLLLMLGATPALLTFFIRLFVPESKRWEGEQREGKTGHWATVDLLAVLVGAVAGCALVYVWLADLTYGIRLICSALLLVVVVAGYSYPVIRYLQRSGAIAVRSRIWSPTLGRMYLAAALSGIALLGTWASIQWAPTWAYQVAGKEMPLAKAYAQMSLAFGACLGTIVAALMGDWLGRRWTYAILCLTSFGAVVWFFQSEEVINATFVIKLFLAGFTTASFYGWLPLYLPELFSTGVRATGQGFGFNFGRLIAAVGTLQMTNLRALFHDSYPQACSALSVIYLIGLVVIFFAPETRGKPLPE